MIGFKAFRTTFENGASPFVRWTLSPVLLLFIVFCVFTGMESKGEGRVEGLLVCVGLGVMCLAGILALWGVSRAGRVVSGCVALAFGLFLIGEILSFDGNWGIGKGRAVPTLLNAMLGFLIFGVPCLIYTVLGRFTVRRSGRESADWPEEDDC